MAKYTFFDKQIWNFFVRPGEVVEIRDLAFFEREDFLRPQEVLE